MRVNASSSQVCQEHSQDGMFMIQMCASDTMRACEELIWNDFVFRR